MVVVSDGNLASMGVLSMLMSGGSDLMPIDALMYLSTVGRSGGPVDATALAPAWADAEVTMEWPWQPGL